jgi:hypothetical protein
MARRRTMRTSTKHEALRLLDTMDRAGWELVRVIKADGGEVHPAVAEGLSDVLGRCLGFHFWVTGEDHLLLAAPGVAFFCLPFEGADIAAAADPIHRCLVKLQARLDQYFAEEAAEEGDGDGAGPAESPR